MGLRPTLGQEGRSEGATPFALLPARLLLQGEKAAMAEIHYAQVSELSCKVQVLVTAQASMQVWNSVGVEYCL